MADHNANKIIVQVQVEPTPAVAVLTQAASSAPRAETAEASNLLSATGWGPPQCPRDSARWSHP